MSHAVVIVAVPGVGDVKEHVTRQMAPFEEGGEWFEDGTRWDWWVIGGRWKGLFYGYDHILKGDFNLQRYQQHERHQLEEYWIQHATDTSEHNVGNALWAGVRRIKNEETKETELVPKDEWVKQRFNPHLSAYAFLRDYCWHERDRLGFFGASAPTECELEGNEPDATKRCVHEVNKDGVNAKIYSWGDDPKWSERYWDRFLRDVPDDQRLVCVDYHI